LAFPPYDINSQGRKARLGVKTLDVRAAHHKGEREYDAHNLYGFAQAQVTAAALKNITGKRPFIISRWVYPNPITLHAGDVRCVARIDCLKSTCGIVYQMFVLLG
jgi:hypothetical protein